MSRPFIFLQYLLPHHALSRLTGRFAESGFAKNLLIRAFIRRYKVDMSEAVNEDPASYKNFNAFFTRALKEGAREIVEAPNSVACPDRWWV